MPFKVTAEGKTFTFEDGTSQEEALQFVDDYFANQGPAKKDPAMFAGTPIERRTPAGDVLDTARAFLQGSTFGFADELGNLVAAPVTAAAQELGIYPRQSGELGQDPGFIEQTKRNYDELQADTRQRADDFREQNPLTSFGAELGGGIATAIALGKPVSESNLGLLYNYAPKTVSTALAMAQGGLYGAGTGKPGERLENAATTAVVSAPFGFVAPYVSNKMEQGLNAIRQWYAGRKLPMPDLSKYIKPDGTFTDDGAAIIGEATGMGDDAAKNAQLLQEFDPNFPATRANLTGKQGDWRFQQEAVKDSNKMRDVLEQQQGIFRQKATEMQGKIGGVVQEFQDAGRSIHQKVTDYALKADAEISNLYQVARERVKGGPVQLNSFLSKLKQLKGEENMSGGVISAVKGELENRGLGKTRVIGDVDEAESIRQYLNSLWSDASPRGRTVIKALKDSLDDDVLSQVGDDVYAAARKAKADFSRQFDLPKNKFQVGKESLAQRILNGKLSPENIVANLKSAELRDLAHLRKFLDKNAPEALTDLKNAVLEDIRKRSFIGKGETGQMLSPDKLKNAIAAYGSEKIKLLLPDVADDLFKMSKASQLTVPNSGAFNGYGPSAGMTDKAIDMATNALPAPYRIPINAVKDAWNRKIVNQAAYPLRDAGQSIEQFLKAEAARGAAPDIDLNKLASVLALQGLNPQRYAQPE